VEAGPGLHEQALRQALADFSDRIVAYLTNPEEPVHPFWAEDVVLINFEPSPFPGTYRGHEGVRQWTRDLFADFTDSRMEVLEVIEEGDRMAVRMSASGSGRSSGIPVSLEWGCLLTMRGGQCIQAASDISYERTLERLRAEAP